MRGDFPWRGLRRRLIQMTVDAVLIAFAWALAFLVRFDGDVPSRYGELMLVTLPPVALVMLFVLMAFRVYARWWRFTTVPDLERILVACLTGAAFATGGLLLWQTEPSVPRGVFALYLVFTVALVGGVRFATRSLIERRLRTGPAGSPVLVCGAGAAAMSLLREMRTNPGLGYAPVGLVDDDPRKRGLCLQGVKVLGGRDGLARMIRETRAREVIIAMPSAPGSVRSDIVARCQAAGARVVTLPGLAELMGEGASLAKLREVQVEDVLGRAPVEVDLARAGGYLSGRRVLVTGAGGSIGSELCRQLCALGITSLVMVDHAEGNLFEIDRRLREAGHGPVAIIADCRDGAVMDRIIAAHRPQVIFHAAAYKHVPMMEANPLEAIANNGLATETLAALALRHEVERMCLISTDKAVEPTTVMGASKALAERVIERHGADGATRFAAVRFGNVLGSSGSVLPIFREQIARGGPVMVTHPEMTRYFMTIPEAVSLVLAAAGIARGGDVFVLDMGEPVRIWDLAEDMIRLAGREVGRDIEIRISGMRPGERLREELFCLDEEVTPTSLPGIRRATRPALAPEAFDQGLVALRDAIAQRSADVARDALWRTLRADVTVT